MAFVVDLLGGDDFVEDRGEGLVLADDVGGDQGGHDELALPDVRLHGNPGQEGHKNGIRKRHRLTPTTYKERAGQEPAVFQTNVGFFQGFHVDFRSFTCTRST